MLELIDVSVKFTSKYAIKDINLSISKGQIVGIIGRSGSGKTTVLRAISGFQKLESGTVKIDGIDVCKMEPGDRGVGYIFQNYTLFPHMDIFHNIAFGLSVRKVEKIELKRRVENISRLLGIHHLLEDYPHQISGGEQQRVAIARSLILSPKVLLFDESFTNLDYNLKIELLEQVRNINKQLGTTIIFVTHDQLDCFWLCDRIILMENGRVVELNTTISLIDSPKTIHAAEFTGIYQILESKDCKELQSTKNKKLINPKYYVKKNIFHLNRNSDDDLSISGKILKTIPNGFYTTVRLLQNNKTIEFVTLESIIFNTGDNITLYFNKRNVLCLDDKK
jgi:putative spermidine/putrescine transport system ATP-binding protein